MPAAPVNALVLWSCALIAGVELAVLAGLAVPPSLQMLLLAPLTIFLGAHLFISSTRGEAAQATISHRDAAQMPFVAGAALVALFACFKFLPAAYVNLVLKGYFCVVGVLALASTLQVVTQLTLDNDRAAPLFTLPALWQLTELPTPVTRAGLAAFALGAAACGWYAATSHWLANNVLGVALSLQALALIPIGRYDVGALMLGGLFFYDVFMVFFSGAAMGPLTGGESIMVAVATKLDGPIKLLFPLPAAEQAPGKRDHSLLGLGDIVIPGILLAFLLRFDEEMAARRADASEGGGAAERRPGDAPAARSAGAGAGAGAAAAPADAVTDAAAAADAAAAERERAASSHEGSWQHVAGDFAKPYFNAALLAYTLGLCVTVVAMHAFEAAQPALLYLVPAVLGASVAQAAWRGELGALLAFRTDAEEAAEGGSGDSAAAATAATAATAAATAAASAAEPQQAQAAKAAGQGPQQQALAQAQAAAAAAAEEPPANPNEGGLGHGVRRRA